MTPPEGPAASEEPSPTPLSPKQRERIDRLMAAVRAELDAMLASGAAPGEGEEE